MGICNIKKILSVFFIFFFINSSHAKIDFGTLEKKKVSYIDFFLLKFENHLVRRSFFLRGQLFATRVQYSNINIQVDFEDRKKIYTKIYAIMDRQRYSKKKYIPKKRDCNQIRNLIFYKKHGYKFFTQKRDPALSTGRMKDIFKEVFFKNLYFSEQEAEFLMNNMLVTITIYHPVKKMELSCSGKVNDYELK